VIIDILMDVSNEQIKASTILANERTFSAWLRTGLATELGGLAISRLLVLGIVHYRWIARIIGVIFILVGMIIYIIALLSYRETLKGIQAEEKGLVMFSFHHLYILTGALLLTAILSLFLAFE
jgi:putative membrane protein